MDDAYRPTTGAKFPMNLCNWTILVETSILLTTMSSGKHQLIFFFGDCCEFVWHLGYLQKRVFPISSGPDEPIPSTYVAQIKQNYCTNQLNCGRLNMHPAECLPNQRYIWEADPLANVFAALARKGPHELKPRSEQVSICKRSSTTIHKQTPANMYVHSDKRPFLAFNLTSWHLLTHLIKAWVQNRIRFFGTVELVI